MKDVVWQPSEEMVKNANVTRFMEKHGISDYDELIERSTEDVEWFWNAVVEDLDITFETDYDEVMDDSDGIPWTDWFVGGQINMVDNVLDRNLKQGRGDEVCLVHEAENGETLEYTYEKLQSLVNRIAAALRANDVEKGDRVALYMPMVPEVVAQLLAIMKIGAIAVPIFSGFAPKAVADRLRDAGVKLVFTADLGYRRGDEIPIKNDLDEALENVDSVDTVIVYRREDSEDISMKDGRDEFWDKFIFSKPRDVDSETMDAMDPAMILYTSGTTGKPKGTVHSHAGTLVNVASEVAYSFDIKEDDLFWWLSDIGWMMGPWMILGAFQAGSKIMVYEGAPDHPGPDRLWDMIERHGVTVFGISPTAIRMLMREGTEPVEKHDLSSLRILGSTGEPWDEESWNWFFEHIGKESCPIVNISGGTDIVGCFLAPLPIRGLKPCSLQGPSLGMDVDVFNEDGESVRNEVGYLVCKKPAPSMTRSLWNNDEKYIDTYWSRWENVWNHGDWARVDEDGFWFLYGRADDTINVAGRRVGPAEIEEALIDHPAVSEAAAVGIPHDVKGESIATFVVLAPDVEPVEELKSELSTHVAGQLGKVDRPEVVEFVPGLPKTRSAKIMRRVIRARYLGEEDLGDLSSCENPDIIDEIPVREGT